MYSDVETISNDERRGKKTNKPMMEKKRRARINHCLSELKDMLIFDKHASAGHAKWEKADILEMTVEYVKRLREAKGLPPVTASAASIAEENDDSLTEPKSSRLVSPAPSSSSSTESSVEPPSAKKRRSSAFHSNPGSTTRTNFSSETLSASTTRPSPAVQLPSLIAHPSPIMPQMPPINPNIGFMAQQLLALQYHQHQMKVASTAPSFMTSGALPTPVPIHMTTLPWRPM